MNENTMGAITARKGKPVIRVSAGTAAALGIKKIKADVLPTTAYLMVGEKCSHDCSFCPQARTSRARGDLLSRVTWPLYDRDEVCRAIAKATEAAEAAEVAKATGATEAAKATGFAGDIGVDSQLQRVCLQVIHEPGRESEDVPLPEVKAFTARNNAGATLPLCVSAHLTTVEQIAALLEAGADRVSLPLDAATATVHRQHKTGSWIKTLELLEKGSLLFPGRLGTHLIAGLGETEEEMVRLIQSFFDKGITVALFAFTPVAGTRAEEMKPPELASYRRIQAAHLLMRSKKVRAEEMDFRHGALVSLGLPPGKARSLLASGEAFRTSGCPGCNRPYYNERPGGVIYNYPRPLTEGEKEEALGILGSILDPGNVVGD